MVMSSTWGNEIMDSVKFAHYDAQGRILFMGEVPEDMVALQGENIYVGEADQATQYIKDGTLAARPLSPVTLDSQNILRGIPQGATIHINKQSYPATANFCALDFTYAGNYVIRVECFPYLDFVAGITK
jgi:hypothetical protein